MYIGKYSYISNFNRNYGWEKLNDLIVNLVNIG